MSSGVPATSSKWTQYTLAHRHEKRAELVCETCHAKKIKCDLQERRRQGIGGECSSCSRSGRQCIARTRKHRSRRITTSSNDNNDDNGSIGNDNNNYDTSNNLNDLSIGTSNTTLPRILPITPPGHDEAARPLAGPDLNGDGHEWLRNQVQPGHKGDVDTGFVRFYAPENDAARIEALEASPRRNPSIGGLQVSEELINIFADTYFNDCYAFCPVLDRETLHQDLLQSPMLQNSLATLGSNVRPPILPHDGPDVHYDRARRMFYEDEEPDNLTCLRGILILYWYAPRSTVTVHRHSSWWWTSIVIRQAQQMGMHRAAASLNASPETSGLGRRVWWTAFARERLTALCQSKPPIIDPDDCSVPEPSLDDFPVESRNELKPLLFIYYVRLCAIIGHIAQCLSRNTPVDQSPGTVAEHCRGWVASLPPQIRISLTTRSISSFDKDAYQLHIPYLIAVIILHLRRAPEPGCLPVALPPAIFAASCVARIYKAILAKGDTRFLMPITAWYCGVPYMALLSASKDSVLREAVLADMEIIDLMCDQLGKMWASAKVVHCSFKRLRALSENECPVPNGIPSVGASIAPLGNDLAASRTSEVLPGSNSFDWIDYFPFASPDTSRTVEILLELRQRNTFVTDPITWDPSLLEIRDWSNAMLNYTDFNFENEFFDPVPGPWVG